MSEKVTQTNQSGPNSMNTGEKSKNLKKAYYDFIIYIGQYKWSLLIAAIFSIIGSILNLIGPNKLSEVTDLITDGLATSIDLNAIYKVGLFLAILYIIGFILNYVQGYIMATVSQKTTQNMRQDISKKINHLPLCYFDSHSTGDILSRVTNDVDTVGQTMNMSFSTLVSSLSLLVGSVIMMFITNWIMAIAGISAALIGFMMILFIISKSQKYFARQQKELGKINAHVEETYSGILVVKAYNGEQLAQNTFHKLISQLYTWAWKSQFMSGIMQPLMTFIGNFAYVVVCIVGAILAMQGTITLGVVVAFMLYIRQFTYPLQNISQALSSVQSMAAACERVFEFLDEEEMVDESYKHKTLSHVKGDITFEHVQFGYDPHQMIIHDFSYQASAGQKIAIVGPTGAGKTTIVNLLMRFYEVNKGQIFIDHTSIQELKRENIHDLFGMVLQDTWLFEGSLRDNLIYNKQGITDEQLDQVCQATGLTSLVQQLPHGYDTILNDSTNLSVGQKQLITIARAMLEDAPLLILDEATSSVDTRTEMKVQKAMDMLTKGRTSFVIAHRLSTIKNADCILVMKDGDIIEYGNHDELMQKGQFYAELYNSQFESAISSL